MLLDVIIESFEGEFSKDIKVKTCPGTTRKRTGNKVRIDGLTLRYVTLLNLPKKALWIC